MSQVGNLSPVQEIKPNNKVDIEVSPPRRRVWTSSNKLQVLKDIDSLKGHHGDIGAYLRQKGLFASTVSLWRKLRGDGLLTSKNKKRGPVAAQSDAQKEIERLEKANIKLQKNLEISRKIIEIQKKISALMDEEK